MFSAVITTKQHPPHFHCIEVDSSETQPGQINQELSALLDTAISDKRIFRFSERQKPNVTNSLNNELGYTGFSCDVMFLN